MMLITKNQTERLARNGEHSAAMPDRPCRHRPVVKIFGGPATWLIAESDPADPDRLFGLADLGMGHPELGWVSRRELEATRVPLRFVSAGAVITKGSVALERDRYWKPTATLMDYWDAAVTAGRIVEPEEVAS
ncbi:MAG: DUF2958 domain-containing protein [bacterium]|nr:DUF2958 domain-containing protein [bacterium]